ncbi:M1 family metallopeptidase [Pontibacter flavimaris]|uniref:Aminopeptidase N n=1 Tax=Pontibacter flavimaris TaxID=1797110 RepID=A0A1Q5PDQ3_9BACT|nr:M1 family aminopeptidase [Pontibacter flavimaris]OKL40378.1 aminopeptidase [Pontibacter flavimaris]
MKKRNRNLLLASIALLSAGTLASCSSSAPATSEAIPVETGVSKELADYRKQVLSHIAYDISLQIPEQKQQPILGEETITFRLSDNSRPMQLDFKEAPDHLKQVWLNGKQLEVRLENEHILLPAKELIVGENEVRLEFIAGDLSLNRNEEYLYTLLVPDRARTVLPVFDQPNLKATFKLSLTLPKDWKALANGSLVDSAVTENSKSYTFATSDTIPTYLFSFAAGKFKHVQRDMKGTTMHFYHRETDPAKIRESINPIFQLHSDALRFMEAYTQIPYPFQKFDFVAIPDFQYGGMEHVGAIQYKASTLFLDETATKDEKISRSNLIAHETAHMWFGDLVTMQWFDDVWMKEVFANFMADKVTQVALENTNYDMKFLVDHFPAAYSIDRTTGANPIRQPLDNLQDAGSLYGSIIYHKAPIMMRQLERLMGEEELRKGLQEYLKAYAYQNATWPDLINILDARTPVDLEEWNQVWVNEPGRPVFSHELKTSNGKIEQLRVMQQGEDGSERVWSQFFEIALVYPDRLEELTVDMTNKEVVVGKAASKEVPQFILFNSTGQGYGVFPVEEAMLERLYTLQDPVQRASAYINLYENMLNGRNLTPAQLIRFYQKGLAQEQEELNIKLISGQLSDVYWTFISPAQRRQLAAQLEQEVWQALQQQQAPNVKKLLFKTYQSIATSKDAQDRLYQVWQKQQPPTGVKLNEDDYTSLALALAVRDYPDQRILGEQLTRIQNPDRKKRLEFLMPALSSDAQVRNAFFASLKEAENREKEAWVASALGYLHHPLRAQTSADYLPQSLELLAEIQRTGDIFFPFNWLRATFGSYQTAEAAEVVRNFLAANPDYNPKLKAKILQAADDLFRAEKLVQE